MAKENVQTSRGKFEALVLQVVDQRYAHIDAPTEFRCKWHNASHECRYTWVAEEDMVSSSGKQGNDL